MKIRIQLCVIFVLLLLASSCKMASIVVDVRQPAIWSLPDSIIELSLNNRIQDSIQHSISITKDMVLKGSEMERMQQETTEITLKSMQDELEISDRFSFSSKIIVDSKSEFEHQLPIPLDPQKVTEICEYNKSDAILSLEFFKSFSDLSFRSYEVKKEIDKNQVWSKNIAYDTRTTINEIARLVVGVEIDWRVYDGKDGNVLLEKNLSDSLVFEAQASTREDAQKKLPSVSQSQVKASTINGLRAIENLSPSYLTVERKYFRYGNQNLRNAYQLVLFRRWNDAKVFWEQDMNNKDRKISSRAAYNLAVVAEMEGKLDRARELIKQAYDLNPTTEISKYKTLLDTP